MKRHFADLWEAISDRFPSDIAIVHGDVRRSWAEYEDRSARLAAALADAGLKPDAKVAIYAYNSNEYLESQFASFKARCVPINVNYRYFETELTYLFDNADVEAVFYQAQFADRLAAIRDSLPKVKAFFEIADGSGQHLDGALDYEAVIANTAPMPRIERSDTDTYMLYTGGTTGMPKGVMYHIGDFTDGLLLAFDIRGLPRPSNMEEFIGSVSVLKKESVAPVSIPACPLMHGTGMWLGALCPHLLGGTVVTLPNAHFDPHEIWQTAERERATDISIVGDAFAKPMVAALEAAEAEGRPYDLQSLMLLISSGVMFTTETKRALLEHVNCTIFDAIGSTEGSMGVSVMNRETPVADTGTFQMNETTKVFTDDGRLVEPGSDEIGMVANGGITPFGYYKDPGKSAATFRVIDGQRYSFPGDYAMVAEDGTLILLGRGSATINTGGEKVFPEEVEEAIKSHPAVYDCLVVGLPDERFGERVTAVLSVETGQGTDEEELMEWLRGRLAGYKLPRGFVFVDEVRRAPNGKADYKWAKSEAADRVG